MSQNYTGRVFVILAVLAMALLAIFSPAITAPRQVGLNPAVPFFEKTNLRPGIDIVGGTSLLYEIKQPEGAAIPNLAEEVMKALKKRVDPTGTKNLVWRPQGASRLEIQMPLTSVTADAGQLRGALDAARAKLEASNVSVPLATDALEGKNGRARADFDKLLAAAPEPRKAALRDLAAAWDAFQAARAANDVAAAFEADARYKAAQQALAATNLSAADLDRVLALKARDQRLAELRQQYAAYPDRLAAIEAYKQARDAIGQGGGLQSANDLKRLLQGSGVLEFHIVAVAPRMGTRSAPTIDDATYADYVARLQAEGTRVKAGDEYKWFEVERPTELGVPTQVYNEKHYVLASMRMNESLDQRSGKWALTSARPDRDQAGQQVVGFGFDTTGGALFGNLTSANVGKPMAIMLDGRVISAPNINQPITGGGGIITGGGSGFSQAELTYLVSTLSAGSLPAQLQEEPIRERTVGPQLGEDNLRSGLVACVLGLIVVAIFLVGYYYLSGVVAYAAVLLNVVIILGAMAAIGATFTLPGIAAMVLTVGTAVDSNVLIFERLREEQFRGLSIRMALRNAYDRAFSAIIDSNMTTLITSAFLILFGTEDVKGFGITLVIGIVASLFTSLFVTKTIFGILVDRFGVKRLGSVPMTYPRWDAALRPNIDWMRLARPLIVFSVAVIALGTFLFVRYLNRGQMFDIEFASGTAVTFETREPVKQERLRDLLEEASRRNPNVLPVPSVVRVGQEGTVWEVTTPNADRRAVQDVIVTSLGAGRDETGRDRPNVLKIDQPSTFEGVKQPLGEVLATAVIPLDTEGLSAATRWPTGAVPPQARDYAGGAAFVLRNLDPPLSAAAITDRLKAQSLQAHTDGSPAEDFGVWTPAADPAAASPVAVVFARNADIPVDKDREKWTTNVVAPMWQMINEAVNNPPTLRQVTSFDASVAADTQRDALIALTLSILGIMAYIWVRFGNLKYATATVVALIHDVLFTIAGIGIAHLLSNTWIGDALQLQPFRINVTIVAGILTVMGFSMLDTIVVFDRIRELRGKYGHLSGRVINDAINQTLSRTLLTASTTIVSIAIMYFIGGPGIHGFTFVLFIGILVGTYSSIAIASPFLLVGGEEAEETAGRDRPVGGRLQRA